LWSEQRRIEISAPEYLHNIVRIISETGLRVIQGADANEKGTSTWRTRLSGFPIPKTTNGMAEVPLTPMAVEAFRDQIRLSPCSLYLFPSDENPADTRRL